MFPFVTIKTKIGIPPQVIQLVTASSVSTVKCKIFTFFGWLAEAYVMKPKTAN